MLIIGLPPLMEGTAPNSIVVSAKRIKTDLKPKRGFALCIPIWPAVFYEDDQINPRFEELMDRLARKNGWFVPVTTLLNHIQEQRGSINLSKAQRSKLERRWLLDKVTAVLGS